VSEPPGFRDFVHDRQAMLLRSAWLLTGDWHAAEDLVQVALVKVWPKWTRITGRGDPDAYVRRVLVTTYLTRRRRRWHGEVSSDRLPDSPDPGREDGLAAVELRDQVTRILGTVSPQQRVVLMLRFYQDLSVEQTASILGCSTGTVKSQTSKALARLTSPGMTEGIR